MDQYREEFLDIDDCRILLRRAGAGRPLVFLHGAGGMTGWPPALAELARHFEVIVPDHPGYGASALPDWLEEVGDLAYFYLDLFARLDLQDITLVGNSLGGWIALELAIRDASRLSSLALLSPAGLGLAGLPKGDNFLWTPEEAVRNLFFDQSYAERMLAQTPTERDLLHRLKNRETTVRLAWHPRFENPRLGKWLRRIDLPVRILWGTDDRLIPPGYAEAFHALLPRSEIVMIEQCGHLPHIEAGPRVVDEIRRLAGG